MKKLLLFLIFTSNFQLLIVESFAQCSVNIGSDTTLCNGQSVTAGINIQYFKDSLTITYDATQGQTGLIGASKVYIHAGAELHEFGGWQYTIGNWGQDDSIGLMKNIGTDLWQVTFEPQTYFGYSADSSLWGIFMVFRDSDGSQTGKDNNGNDIWMDAKTNPPASGFTGVTGVWIQDVISSIIWSTGETTSSITINSSGTFSVQVTDTNNCIANDSVTISILPQINLGNDTTICSSDFPVQLNADAGYTNYFWNGNSGSQNFSANNEGTHIVNATFGNCQSSDTIQISSGIKNSDISLGNDTSICGFATIILNSGVVVSPFGDSLVITYDATQGQSGLVGAAKVYMHSGAELHFLGGWQYTTGNWGQDDSIGLMKNIGTDLWQITIKPQNYFGYPADSSLWGIFMVFRNFDGSQTGKDNNGNDIWMDTKTNPPTNGFSGVNAWWKGIGISNILWSDSSSNTTLLISNSGNYSVIITDMYGCFATDSISISTSGLPFVDIGNDVAFCTGNSLVLDADTGFSSYSWSTGETAQIIAVDSTGTYSITVTNSAGCSGFDMVNITVENTPVADFTFSVNGMTVDFTNTSQNASDFYWHFFGTSFIHDSTNANPGFTYTLPGTYNVLLVIKNSCGSDSVTKSIVIVGVDEIANEDLQFSIYPNPNDGNFNLKINQFVNLKRIQIDIYDLLGENVFSKQLTPKISGQATNNEQLTTDLTSGIYFLELNFDGHKVFKKFIIQ